MNGNFSNYIKSKWKHAGFQRYFRNIGWMFVARLSSMIISFVATSYIARGLGATNYGELSYAVSFVSLFGFLASFGIDQVLCRDLIRYPSRRNEYMGTALFMRLILSTGAFVLCILFGLLFSTKDVSLILIPIISLSFIFSSFQLLGYEFQADAKLKGPSILSTIVVLLLNLLKIWVIKEDRGVIYLSLIILIEPMLYGIGLLFLRLKEYGTASTWRFNREVAISIIKDSYPLVFASAFFSIYARIDQVMIKNFIGAESVGLYDSAVRISEMWYFIPNIVVTGLFPTIVNAKSTSEDIHYKRIKKLFLLLLFMSVATAFITTVFSKTFILIIFGAGFLGAVSVLQIYVWSNVGAAINLLTQQILVTENLTKLISFSIFFGMVFNVLLNLILIPKYGIVGAAYASMLSYMAPILSLLFYNRSRKIIFNVFSR